MNDWLQDIGELKLPPLEEGAHSSPDEGLCAMEMVAFIERLEHTDEPKCTCPVIAEFVRGINDCLGTDDRQRLLAYLPRLVDTVSPKHEKERGEYLAWAAIRKFAPAALRRAGMEGDAIFLKSQSDDLRKAAHAARTVEAAAYTAYAAAHAAAHAVDAPLIFSVLDGLLEIGPQGKWTDYDSEHVRKLESYA